jgi:hypothetical protein
MSTVCHPQGVAGTRALTTDTLGAWLFKAIGSEPSTQAHLRAGFADAESWCVRPTYRTDPVDAGSNPSYVTRDQLRVLALLCPELAEHA